MSKKGKEARDRSRSPVDGGRDANAATFSAQELGDMLNSAIQAQMPRMIIEASKVAREQLESDRDDAQKSFAAKFRRLEQSQAELTLNQKASSLKTDGKKTTQSVQRITDSVIFFFIYIRVILLIIESSLTLSRKQISISTNSTHGRD